MTACTQERNAAQTRITWKFRTADARVKMQRISPKLMSCQSSNKEPI